MKRYYRIVTDAYSGYEVQWRYWWMPFYIQGFTNTHPTIEAAERYAKGLADGQSRVVKELGELG